MVWSRCARICLHQEIHLNLFYSKRRWTHSWILFFAEIHQSHLHIKGNGNIEFQHSALNKSLFYYIQRCLLAVHSFWFLNHLYSMWHFLSYFIDTLPFKKQFQYHISNNRSTTQCIKRDFFKWLILRYIYTDFHNPELLPSTVILACHLITISFFFSKLTFSTLSVNPREYIFFALKYTQLRIVCLHFSSVFISFAAEMKL